MVGGFPKRHVYAGIVVGLLLVLVGVGLLTLGNNALLFSLMTCVGFGIVLAAFGSTGGGSCGESVGRAS